LDKIGFEDHVEETQESHGVYDADQHPAQVKVLALLGQQSGQGKRDEGDEGAGESRQDDGRIDAAYVAEERSQGLSRAEAGVPAGFGATKQLRVALCALRQPSE